MSVKISYNQQKLLDAAENGDIQAAKEALKGDKENPPAHINFSMKRGNVTALFAAIRKKQYEMVEFLVEQGADIEHTDCGCDTALIIAAIHNWSDMIEFLLEKGANVNAQNNEGKTAMSYVVKNGDIDTLRKMATYNADFLIKDNMNHTLLMELSLDGSYHYPEKQLEIAKFLIERGIDINAVNKNGVNALQFISHGRNLKLAHYLIKQGADVNARSNDGETALMRVAMFGNKDKINLLLDNGADIHLKDNRKETALMAAIDCAPIAACRLLLERGADKDINNVNSYGQTAFISSFTKDSDIEKLKLLLEYGAVIDDTYRYPRSELEGMTLLIAAVEMKEIEKVKLLVEHGVDLDNQDNNGKTAIILAAKKKQYDVVKYLAQQGARLDIEDDNERTVYDYLKNDSPETVRFLKRIELKRRKEELRQEIADQTGDELLELSQQDAQFLKQLVTTGLLVDAVKKMTYAQTRSLYTISRAKLNNKYRERVENIIRDKRQNDKG